MSPPRAVWLWETHGWGKPTDHRLGIEECGDKLSSFSMAKKVQIRKIMKIGHSMGRSWQDGGSTIAAPAGDELARWTESAHTMPASSSVPREHFKPLHPQQML